MKNLSTKNLIKSVEKKLPKQWDFERNYVLTFTGYELDAICCVIDDARRKGLL